MIMRLARSRLTAQGQISVPAAVRQRLGLAPGATLEWHDDGTTISVRRVGAHDSETIHALLFRSPPRKRSVREMDAGIVREVRARHARD